MPIGSIGLALVAGLLSTLSPCVLPLLPLLVGAAVSEHRLGPVALAGGLGLSFVAIGLFVATIGYSIGFGTDVFRGAAGVMMLLAGGLLMLPSAQARLAVAAGPVSNWAERRFGRITGSGLRGQFALGMLLGAVWSPCVGPTLGAASLIAARGSDLATVAMVMLAFGIGAALPLILLGLISREAVLRWRGHLSASSQNSKFVFGAVLGVMGILILTAGDRVVEAALVAASPHWLTILTTRF